LKLSVKHRPNVERMFSKALPFVKVTSEAQSDLEESIKLFILLVGARVNEEFQGEGLVPTTIVLDVVK